MYRYHRLPVATGAASDSVDSCSDTMLVSTSRRCGRVRDPRRKAVESVSEHTEREGQAGDKPTKRKYTYAYRSENRS